MLMYLKVFLKTRKTKIKHRSNKQKLDEKRKSGL